MLYFNQTPIIELKRYNDDVFAKETALRAGDNFLNKTQYFTPMVEYLTQFSKEGDILVQNPFETSSDKNTPHLQFIPGDVPLPLFYQNSQVLIDDKYQQVDWHLPTLAVTVDSRQHAGENRQNGYRRCARSCWLINTSVLHQCSGIWGMA